MSELNEIKNRMRGNVVEKDYWTSYAVKEYFTDISKAILDRYGSDFQMDVSVIYDPTDNIAYTTFDTIVLNAACKQVQKVNRLENKTLYLKGLLAHELSHVLYMDKKLNKRYFDSLKNGIIIPRIPNMGGREEAFIQTVKDKKKSGSLCSILKYLLNSTEDGYGENTYLANYYGSLIDGMKYMRREFYKDLKSSEKIEQLLADDDPAKRYNGVQNIVLVYALYGRLKGSGTYPLAEAVVERISGIIKKSFECNFKERLNCLNMLAVELWDFIEPILNQKDDDKKKGKNNQVGNNTGDGGGNESGGNGGAGEGDSNGIGSESPRNKPDHNDDEGNTLPLSAQHERALVKPYDDSEDVKDMAADEADDLMEQVIDELSRKEKEKQNLATLNREANEGKSCGCDVKIYRDVDVTPAMKKEYERYQDILEVSKRMQRVLKQQLDDKRKGGKKSGLYLGRKVEVRAVIRNDGKCFYNNALPKDTPRICVSLVIDESGSMKGCDNKNIPRITYAKRAAVIIEDFCRMLGFPVMIIGTTADWQFYEKGELTVYSSFDAADNNDRYRLMGIYPKNCNRDGAAFAFALQQLLKRQEEVKILFIVSDGKPNAFGYGGLPAINELKQLNEKAKKSNVVVFSAAIGEDKKQIESIYGDAFLDITDLDAMPRMFIDRIKTFIR